VDEFIKYFLLSNNIKNIGNIKWAHAVNSVKYLEQSLADPEIDFLEIDIGLSKSNVPIAAHYTDERDLTFNNLLNLVKKSDKGIKLDFKDHRAVESSLRKLHAGSLKQPVILNTDVLSTNGAPEAVVPSQEFIDLCQKYYAAGLLSLGWRTTEDSAYTTEDIDKMLYICGALDEATFPVRASILPRSWQNVKRLIEKENYTLSIWNGGRVDNDLKDWIIKNTDPQKSFYDLSYA
jgi:hypothetical protein